MTNMRKLMWRDKFEGAAVASPLLSTFFDSVGDLVEWVMASFEAR